MGCWPLAPLHLAKDLVALEDRVVDGLVPAELGLRDPRRSLGLLHQHVHCEEGGRVGQTSGWDVGTTFEGGIVKGNGTMVPCMAHALMSKSQPDESGSRQYSSTSAAVGGFLLNPAKKEDIPSTKPCMGFGPAAYAMTGDRVRVAETPATGIMYPLVSASITKARAARKNCMFGVSAMG